MTNLFFVHTPMQLIVAQQVIHYEKLTDNIMLYGYIENNPKFLKSYDVLAIDELWRSKIYFEHLPDWADLSHRFPIKGFFKTLQHFKDLKRLFKEQQVDTLYFGDIDNVSYQFAFKVFKNLNYQIKIFEEGTSHYNYLKRAPLKRRFKKAIIFVIDNCFYRPFFGFRFAAFWFREGDVRNLPVDTRYTIIPGYYNEPYDKALPIDFDLKSNSMDELIRSQIKDLYQYDNVDFFMTSLIYEYQDSRKRKERYEVYLKVIEEYLKQKDSGVLNVIKLHPREGSEVQDAINEIANRINTKVVFISNDIVIPCEMYLQALKPKRVSMFFGSSTMYNGYLYPKCEIIDLMPQFITYCDNMNLDIDDVKHWFNNAVSERLS